MSLSPLSSLLTRLVIFSRPATFFWGVGTSSIGPISFDWADSVSAAALGVATIVIPALDSFFSGRGARALVAMVRRAFFWPRRDGQRIKPLEWGSFFIWLEEQNPSICYKKFGEMGRRKWMDYVALKRSSSRTLQFSVIIVIAFSFNRFFLMPQKLRYSKILLEHENLI